MVRENEHFYKSDMYKIFHQYVIVMTSLLLWEDWLHYKIGGSHNSGYEEFSLLRYNAAWSIDYQWIFFAFVWCLSCVNTFMVLPLEQNLLQVSHLCYFPFVALPLIACSSIYILFSETLLLNIPLILWHACLVTARQSAMPRQCFLYGLTPGYISRTNSKVSD
jgi:hypothetical protein